MMTPEENPYINETLAGIKVSEFVKRIPVAKATVYRMAKDGRIKTVRFGRTVLVPMDEVRRLLSEGTIKPDAA